MTFDPNQTGSFKPSDHGIESHSEQLDAAARKLIASFSPLTAITTKVRDFGSSIDGIRVPMVATQAAFRLVSGESQKLARYIDTANQVFTSFTAGLTSVAQNLVQSVMLPVAPLEGLAQIITPFISAFNPALVEQLGLALTDLAAVVGAALSPVMTEITEIIRRYADMLMQSNVPELLSDILMTIVTAIEPLIPVMLQLMQALLPIVKLFVDIFVPVIKFVAKVLQALIDVVHIVQQALYDFVRAVMNFVPDNKQRWRIRDFELERQVEKKSKEDKSSMNLGVRNVTVATGGGALDSLRQRMATSALKMGGDETLKVARDQLATAKEQLDALNELIKQKGGDANATQAELTLRYYLERKAEGFTDEEADLAAREDQRLRIDGDSRGRRRRRDEIVQAARDRIAGVTASSNGNIFKQMANSLDKLVDQTKDNPNGNTRPDDQKRAMDRMANQNAAARTG